MKKSFLILCTLLLALNIQAQEATLIPKPVSNMWLMRPLIKNVPISQDGNNAYLYMHTDNASPLSKKPYTDHVYTFNNALENQDMLINVPYNHFLLGALDGGDKLVFLYQSLNSKGDMVTFTVSETNKQTKNHTITDDKIVTTNVNKKFWPSYQTATSPNGKLLAALVLVTGKKGFLENLFAIVVNDEGKIVWSNPIELNFNNLEDITFSIEGMTVSNYGTVYLAINTCYEKNERISDMKFNLVQVSAEGTKMHTENVEFGKLQHSTIKELSNGDIFCAGFFSDSYKNTMDKSTGHFFYRFDPKKEFFTDQKHYDFGEKYRERSTSALMANKLANQQYAISADYIFELANGDVALCGEHQFIKAIYDGNTNSWSYSMLTKNILVPTYHSDGNADFSMIEKQQIAGGSSVPKDWKTHNVSYSAFVKGNDIHFVFNDDPRNVPYPGDGVVCGMNGLVMNNATKTVMMTLSPDQSIAQRILPFDDQIFRAVEFSNEKQFITSGISKKGLIISKFRIEEE